MAGKVLYLLHTYVDIPERYRSDLGSPGTKQHRLAEFDTHFYPGARPEKAAPNIWADLARRPCKTTRREDLRQDLKAIQQNRDADGPQLPEKTACDLQWLRAVGYYSL